MTKLLSGLLLAASVALPGAAMAATYQYVTVGGTLSTITASSSAEALVLPADIAPHSGVILIEDQSDMVAATTTVAL